MNKSLYLLASLIIFLMACGPQEPQKYTNSDLDSIRNTDTINYSIPDHLDKMGRPEVSETGDTSYYKIPDFVFTNQDGDTITNETYKDKIYVADFFFTSCPGICPIIKKNELIVYEEFKNNDKVMFLSHTLTPKKDDAKILKTYANNLEVDQSKWNFVTGDPELIHNFSRSGYYLAAAFNDEAPGGVDHSNKITLIDGNGHIRGYYTGIEKNMMQKLIVDIKFLLQESSKK